MTGFRHHRIATLAGALYVAILATLIFGASPRVGHSQGFPGSCIYPFAGQQPAATCDFSNPPVSFQRQGARAFAEVIPFGSVAYGSLGNATTYVSATVYQVSIVVPGDMTVTNINCLNAGTVGTNSVIYALYNSAGTKIGQTLNSGTATAGANAFQTIALTTPLAIQGPSQYWIGVQANGATDNIRTIAASTFVNAITSSTTGVFGTLPALTPATTFTANVGPLCYLN
jgi:hypothetical protein